MKKHPIKELKEKTKDFKEATTKKIAKAIAKNKHHFSHLKKYTKSKLIKVISDHKCPNNNLFFLGVWSFIVFLLYEILIRAYNLYYSLPIVDVPNHFLAGIVLAFAISWVLSLTHALYAKGKVIFFTFIIAGVWEILEMLEDALVYNVEYMRDYFFYDGITDMIVTTLGAFAGIVILSYLKNNTHLFDDIKIS